MARTRFKHTWREDQTSIDCQSDIEQVLSAWRTAVTKLPYFPEHPTQEERDFYPTEVYILRFYRWSPPAHEDFTGSPVPEGSTSYGAPSTSSMAVQAELTSLRSKRDCLRREVAENDEQVINQRQLQRELAQAPTTHVHATDESCPPSRVDNPRSSPLHGETCLCAPEFHLVGARMRALMQRSLGVSTFPGTRDGCT
ncbi:hypothetical protein CRG98_021653 [Punica granatum]|uniref:Uncharacterized protein n=1 Tax=Punica granatum TaxID=22663 RepID=A0A2I0JNR4_PUNGR|nr:hypothetical protein CRG98_021653 [Punica granatum]